MKKGKWVVTMTHIIDKNKMRKWTQFEVKCSECDCSIPYDTVNVIWQYCPECGSKMDINEEIIEFTKEVELC